MNNTAKRWGRNARLVAIVGAAALALVAFAGIASAATETVTGGAWNRFVSSSTIGGSSVSGPYTFTSTSVAKVTVTDAFCIGDTFRVYDNGALLGETSPVVNEYPACESSGAQWWITSDERADGALADPDQSHAVFFVAPGEHSLEFETITKWSPLVGSGAFFRVEDVTVSTADCQGDGWTNYGGLFANQGDCVSFVATNGTNLPSGQ